MGSLWNLTGGFWVWVECGGWAWASALGPITSFIFCLCVVMLFVLLCVISCWMFPSIVCFCLVVVVGRPPFWCHHAWKAEAHRTLGLCKQVTHDCFYPSVSPFRFMEHMELPVLVYSLLDAALVFARCLGYGVLSYYFWAL